MKTNNRLSKDNNTHEPKVRPMVKEIEYRHFSKGLDGMGEWFPEIVKDKFWEYSGNTREVERPMNDTEYIKYLEKENQELKDQLRATNESYSNQLWLMKCGGIEIDKDGYKPINQWRHTKEQLYDIAIKNYELLFIERKLRNNDKDQLLKIVESVLKEHPVAPSLINGQLECLAINCDTWRKQTYIEHLLQEIKSVIESTNLEQVQDKKGEL